jgi:Tol biopolymer transport system component
VFCSANSGVQQLFRSAADGSGKVELLLKSDRDLEDPDWSQDGRFLVYPQVDKSTGRDLWTLPISSDGRAGTPSPFLQTQNEEDQPAFSPDGHWIAYASDPTGRREVYVRPFPKKDGLAKVSVAGGEAPRWRGDGKELFFVAPDGMLMSVDTSAGFQHPVPKPLFKTDMTAKMGWSALPHGYAVSKNGQRFLLRVPERDSSNRITVVVNWPATIHK